MDELVSVIMPSYNTASYIGASIRSVLAQTYTNLELLIVDDRSTDDTDAVIAGFDDRRIRYFKNEKNGGAAMSRNRALREAKGKWIAFLDSDDIWEPEKLSRQLAYMKENGYAFTFTDYRIQLNGEWLPYICTGPDVVGRRKMIDYCYFFTSTVMYDREAIGLIQVEEALRKNNDYAMWLRAIEKSPAHRLPECLSYYIKHDGSVSGGSKWTLIRWHYLLFRVGQKKGPIASAVLTLNNLFHGVIKKLRYKEAIQTVPDISVIHEEKNDVAV